MDCEAAQILLGIQEQMVLLSRDPTIKLPVWVIIFKAAASSSSFIFYVCRSTLKSCNFPLIFSSFDKALNYAKTGARYTNPQSVRRVVEYPCFLTFWSNFYVHLLLFAYHIAFISSDPFWIINSNIRSLKKHGVTDGEVSVFTLFVFPVNKKRWITLMKYTSSSVSF